MKMTSKERILAKKWCSLNRWDKVKIGRNTYGGREDKDFAIAIMATIEMAIGKKKCLEEWNTKS